MSEHINNFSKVAKKLHLLEILLTFIWPHICYNIDNVIKKTNLLRNTVAIKADRYAPAQLFVRQEERRLQ